MRILISLACVGIVSTAGVLMAGEPKVYTPEQIEAERPTGEVTVRFKVGDFGLLDGVIRQGDPPFMPISLEAGAKLKDKRNSLYVVLVDKALTHVHHLGIFEPGKHFVGRTIEATAKVRYIKLPQITEGGVTRIPDDNYTHYEMVIGDLDHFRVVE